MLKLTSCHDQIYNSTVTQMSACLLSLSVMSLLLPARQTYPLNDSNVIRKLTK